MYMSADPSGRSMLSAPRACTSVLAHVYAYIWCPHVQACAWYVVTHGTTHLSYPKAFARCGGRRARPVARVRAMCAAGFALDAAIALAVPFGGLCVGPTANDIFP